MKFEDTALLPHPIVKKAYRVMRGFFKGGDDYARQAIRAGEVLSQKVKNPDPDLIAATVISNGMVIPLRGDQFAGSVSQRTADYLDFFFNLNIEKPVYHTEEQRQLFLANSIVALGDILDEINSGRVWRSHDIKKKLELNAINIEAVAEATQEQGLVTEAFVGLHRAQKALDDLITDVQQKAVFEKTGLPDHPMVRKAYELIRTDEMRYDPLFDNRSRTGVDIAKIIIDSGTSSDPEVIAVAILNQYHNLGKRYARRLEEISPRVLQIHKEAYGVTEDRTTEEAVLIASAMRINILDHLQKTYASEYGTAEQRKGRRYDAMELLEDIEFYTKRLKENTAGEKHQGFKAIMEKSIAAAERIMYAPQNVRIRKPGSPPLERGW